MNVIVIGGGASGVMAAIQAVTTGCKVTIIEHEKQIGKKLLITGNGRCNITNTNMSSDMYYGDKEFIDKILCSFNPEYLIKLFENMGLYTVSKNGYIYPKSLQASSVLFCLRTYAERLGVKIKTNNRIKSIKKDKQKFIVDVGVELLCDKLIIATGGLSYEKTGSRGDGYAFAKQFGHTVIKTMPALTALICNDNYITKASGVRCSVKLYYENVSEEGELQITDYGISGIPVFNISRNIKKNHEIIIDFMPDTDREKLSDMLYTIIKLRESTIDNALWGIMNDKLALALTCKSNLHNKKCADISFEDIDILVSNIKSYKAVVEKRRGFEFAQVTSGGVDTDEICSDTMESKLVKGLYFAGEVLNVDGKCGGYNLHFAFATGAIAGRNLK